MISQRAAAHLSLLVAALVWGLNFTAMHILLAQVQPLDVVAVRTLIGAVGFAVLLVARRQPLPPFTRAEWARIALLGLLGVTVFNMAAAYGQQHLPASLTSLIVSSNPIFTAIAAAAVGVEVLARSQVGGVALASLGLAIVVLGDAGVGTTANGTVVVSALILLIAPVSWSVYTVVSKPMLVRHPPVPMAGLGVIAGAILLAPTPLLAPGMLGRLAAMTWQGWAAAFFGGIGSLVIVFVLWNRGLQTLSPSGAAVYSYLVPVFGLLFAWLLLGEAPTLSLLIGGAAIFVGVVLTNRRTRPSAETLALLTAAPEP